VKMVEPADKMLLRIPIAAGAVAAGIGLLVLAGWLLGLEALKSVLPGLATMKANTAVCFLLAGAALVFRERRPIRLACAGLVCVVAGLSLSEYFSGGDLGLDQLLFRDRMDMHTVYPGRMAEATALGFLFCGMSLLLLKTRSRAFHWLQQALALGAAMIGTMALLGYAFHVQQLYRFSGKSSMALHTALSLLILAAGVVFARSGGLGTVLMANRTGAQMARRILPGMLLPLVLFGLLIDWGEGRDLWGEGMNDVLLAMLMIVTITGLVFWTARILNRMDAERRKTEAQLRESEARFRSIMDDMLEGCQIIDHDWRFIYINDAAERHNRRPTTELIGKNYMDMWPGIESTRVFGALRRCMVERTPETMENEFVFPDGTVGWFELSIQPVREGIFILSMDITERKRAEKALVQNREDLDRAQMVGQIGSWRLDVLHDVLTWSDETYRIFGLPRETPMTYETFLETIHPDDRQYVDSKWKAGLSGEPYDIEHRIIAGGKLKWIREKAYLEFDEAKNLLGGFGITQDISAHKQAEEKIQASLREKETLLRELSHRTKNNLNVISSLISLQIGSLQDPRLADLFRDMQSRILTMSLIHEKLYQSSELSSINIRAYITDLTDAILSGYRVEREKVTVRLDIENILFSLDDVTPCGLIINELMSNSLKYAFPEGRPGEIWITLQQLAGEEMLLIYRDTGVGFPGGFDWSKTKSLGLKLVQRLATQQLRGKIEFRGEADPEFLIRFPRSHAQK